jgi:predicted glycosyltransferase
VTFYGVVPGLTQWLDRVDALVCMGGYNTMAEAVARGTPTVCIPRTRPRVEQLIRAQAFARLDLSRALEPQRLTPGTLRREVAAVLGTGRRDRAARATSALGFDGAMHAARSLIELAQITGNASRPGIRSVA